ncbi:MAG: MBL fold metallo-hydrolase [Mangrovibacterium sp.]
MDKLEICALASGSNGNCYYIGNDQEAILVDAGLSARQLQLRMLGCRLDAAKIKAILVTHEHSDHCCGIRVFSKRLGGIPVYLTKKTYLAIHARQRPEKVIWFDPNIPFMVGSFEIFPFTKQHDAVDACSFRISYGGRHIGVMTDIGDPCEQVKQHFSLCDAVFLETNYDEDMLRNGPYPYYLKQRISSAFGHLSNKQALCLVESCAGERLKTILLSHLSGENNTPQKAFSVFQPLQKNYQIELTSRQAPTKVFPV